MKFEIGNKNVFFISSNALKQIKFVIKDNRNKFLRIEILSGGCNGFQYKLYLDTEVSKDDLIVSEEKNAMLVVIDKTSIDFLSNCTLDYINDDLGSSFFRIDNPNASSSCGCGESFSI